METGNVGCRPLLQHIFYFFTYSDCTLLTDMSSDIVHPLKSFGLAQHCLILYPTQLCGKIPEGVSWQSRSYPMNTGSSIIQPPCFTVYTDKLYSLTLSHCYGLLQMTFCGQINKVSFSYWLLVREQVYICIQVDRFSFSYGLSYSYRFQKRNQYLNYFVNAPEVLKL